MTDLDRIRNIQFCGIQDFDGKCPSLAIFQDPLTQTSFSLKVDETVGEAIDRLRVRWGEVDPEHALGDTLDDPDATEDLMNDRALQDKLDER